MTALRPTRGQRAGQAAGPGRWRLRRGHISGHVQRWASAPPRGEAKGPHDRWGAGGRDDHDGVRQRACTGSRARAPPATAGAARRPPRGRPRQPRLRRRRERDEHGVARLRQRDDRLVAARRPPARPAECPRTPGRAGPRPVPLAGEVPAREPSASARHRGHGRPSRRLSAGRVAERACAGWGRGRPNSPSGETSATAGARAGARWGARRRRPGGGGGRGGDERGCCAELAAPSGRSQTSPSTGGDADGGEAGGAPTCGPALPPADRLVAASGAAAGAARKKLRQAHGGPASVGRAGGEQAPGKHPGPPCAAAPGRAPGDRVTSNARRPAGRVLPRSAARAACGRVTVLEQGDGARLGLRSAARVDA